MRYNKIRLSGTCATLGLNLGGYEVLISLFYVLIGLLSQGYKFYILMSLYALFGDFLMFSLSLVTFKLFKFETICQIMDGTQKIVNRIERPS